MYTLLGDFLLPNYKYFLGNINIDILQAVNAVIMGSLLVYLI